MYIDLRADNAREVEDPSAASVANAIKGPVVASTPASVEAVQASVSEVEPPATEVIPATSPADQTSAAPVPDPTPTAPVTASAELHESPDLVHVPEALRRPKGMNSSETQRLAYAALFARWNRPFDTEEIPCNYAPQVGLQCLKQQGTWDDVLKLDRPVVLELRDARPDPYYAAVLDTDLTSVRVRVGNTETEVTLEDLATAWIGKFVVLWAMPPNYRGNLKLGDSDPGVAWLRQRLSTALGRNLGPAGDRHFDQTLFDALVEFQHNRGLDPDGIAGPHTWIHLGSGSAQPTLAVAHAG
jgi:general secretion pathway protein A